MQHLIEKDNNRAKRMMIENKANVDIPSTETSLNAVKDRIMPVLKAASDLCEVPVALVYLQKDTDIKIVASIGDYEEPVVSAVKKISGMLDPDNGLSIIKNIREHKEAASELSELWKWIRFSSMPGHLSKMRLGTTLGVFVYAIPNLVSSPRIRSSNFS
jgi:hypothetical protein